MTYYRGLVEPMIVRYHNVSGNSYGIKLDLGTEGEGIMLMDVEALSVRLGRRSPATIRKHCTVIACDWATWRQLYNADEAITRMADIPERKTVHRQGQLQTASL